MKKISTLILAILITLTSTGQEQWESLFNGKDLSGWKLINGSAIYLACGGEIVGFSRLNSPNSFLATEKVYGDFILELEYKIDPGLNSGVQFRSLSKPEFQNGRVHGYQYEFDTSPRAWSGGIYDEARRGWLYPLDLNPEAKKAFNIKGWKIDNGVLKVTKSDGGESTNGGDIVTIKKYRNFELQVDFQITEGANSGIKYFVDTELNQGAGSSIGCEFQILDDQRHPDAKLGVNGNRKLGSLYDLIAAPQNKPFRNNFFNRARIVVKDNKVEHYLNDIKIIEYERGTQQWRALVAFSKYNVWPNFGEAEEGHILLQDHGDEVRFKNIKIREL